MLAAVLQIRQLHTANALRQYVVDLVAATRQHRALRLGASPRAGLQLLRAARTTAIETATSARAFQAGRSAPSGPTTSS